MEARSMAYGLYLFSRTAGGCMRHFGFREVVLEIGGLRQESSRTSILVLRTVPYKGQIDRAGRVSLWLLIGRFSSSAKSRPSETHLHSRNHQMISLLSNHSPLVTNSCYNSNGVFHGLETRQGNKSVSSYLSGHLLSYPSKFSKRLSLGWSACTCPKKMGEHKIANLVKIKVVVLVTEIVSRSCERNLAHLPPRLRLRASALTPAKTINPSTEIRTDNKSYLFIISCQFRFITGDFLIVVSAQNLPRQWVGSSLKKGGLKRTVESLKYATRSF